jgi:thiol-disulfide isomerase/thioredoxin
MKYLFLGLLALFLAAPAQALVQTGTNVPALSLPDNKQDMYYLPDMTKGKVAMFVYWSMTCSHCHKYMPHFLFMNKRLTGNNFIMVFVNSDGEDMASALSKFAAGNQLPAPWLLDPSENMPFAQALDITATPAVFIYDVSGQLIMAQDGDIDIDLLMETIQKAF